MTNFPRTSMTVVFGGREAGRPALPDHTLLITFPSIRILASDNAALPVPSMSVAPCIRRFPATAQPTEKTAATSRTKPLRIFPVNCRRSTNIHSSQGILADLLFHRQHMDRLSDQLHLVALFELQFLYRFGRQDGRKLAWLCHFELDQRHNIALLNRRHFSLQVVPCTKLHCCLLENSAAKCTLHEI